VFGFLFVALGAFGEHALASWLQHVPDGVKRLEWWHTAAAYHGIHSLALAFTANVLARHRTAAATVAAAGYCIGIVLFSGSLYAMALTGIRALAIVTPLGGIALLTAWGAIIAAAISRPKEE
jgi:uncharacterized membrane protein YgdD (TMEM256/DUF423 family)